MRHAALRAGFMVALVVVWAHLAERTYAQTHHPEPRSRDRLVFTLILSRHGVRPPLSTTDALAKYATSPWPAWEVPLGDLTPHGADALARMGEYLRADLARRGLLSAMGCANADDVYLYSDTDERNIASTRATFAAFNSVGGKQCAPLPVVTFVAKIVDGKAVRDPIFNRPAGAMSEPLSASSIPATQAAMAAMKIKLNAETAPETAELARVLVPDATHPAATAIADTSMMVRSTLAEDFLLEYTDAKPLSDVAWGRLGKTDAQTEAAIRRLMKLNVAGFYEDITAPQFARTAGANLMAHILATLGQASGDVIMPGSAFGPAGTKLVYLSGHDSNLHAIAGLLGLHWADPRLTANDTPPDSQIVFELWQRPGSKQTIVRIKFRAQTLAQLRSAAPLTGANKPVEILLTPPGCRSAAHCSYAAFQTAAAAAIDQRAVMSGPLNTQLAP